MTGYDPRVCTANQSAGQLSGAPAVPSVKNPGSGNYLACEGPSPYINGGQLAIPNPETGVFDGFGAFKDPFVLGVNLQVGYDLSKRVHANMLVTNLFNRCFGGSKAPWTQGVNAPGSIICGYSPFAGPYVSNYYNGSSPYDTAANGTAVMPNMAHAYGPAAQPFQPLNLYFQVNFKI